MSCSSMSTSGEFSHDNPSLLPHIAEQSKPARLHSQETLQVLNLQDIKSKSFSGAGERVIGVGCSELTTKLGWSLDAWSLDGDGF